MKCLQLGNFINETSQWELSFNTWTLGGNLIAHPEHWTILYILLRSKAKGSVLLFSVKANDFMHGNTYKIRSQILTQKRKGKTQILTHMPYVSIKEQEDSIWCRNPGEELSFPNLSLMKMQRTDWNLRRFALGENPGRHWPEWPFFAAQRYIHQFLFYVMCAFRSQRHFKFK